MSDREKCGWRVYYHYYNVNHHQQTTTQKVTTKSNSRNCLFTLFMQYFRANDCYISRREFFRTIFSSYFSTLSRSLAHSATMHYIWHSLLIWCSLVVAYSSSSFRHSRTFAFGFPFFVLPPAFLCLFLCRSFSLALPVKGQ